MKVSYDWLKTYFAEGDIPSVDDIVDKFTFRIFEVDGVEVVDNDTVIDLDILPNRAHDCLGHRGVAHEVAALFDIKMSTDPMREDIKLEPVSKEMVLTVDDVEANPVHTVALIKGVEVGESPSWLKTRLEAIGQRSINNIVDATNYVMFGLGQPTHVFDYDKLTEDNGKRGIKVRAAKDGEQLTLLGGTEAELTTEMYVLADAHNDEALDVAGVKGGVQAELSNETTSVLVTAAKFNPIKTRRTATKLKLRTDAVQRFENEIPNHLPIVGMRSVVDLILEVAGGEVEGFITSGDYQSQNSAIKVTVQDIEQLLGISVPANKVAEILTQLEFKVEQDADSFVVTAPWERLDINIPEDVIEEVARVYGYEHMEGVPLPQLESVPVSKKFYYLDKVREILLMNGFREVYLYPLCASGEFKLINSLSVGKDHYRVNLSGGISSSIDKNIKNMPLLGLQNFVKLFEIGNVYKDGKESLHIAMGVGVQGKKKTQERIEAGLTAAVSGIEALLDIKLPTKVDGIVEFDLDELLIELSDPSDYENNTVIGSGVSYSPVSPYPFIVRDIAVWVPESVDESDIVSVINKHGRELVQRIDKFDEFAKDDKVSLAFHIVFQSMEKTLTDDEVGEVMAKIEAELSSKDGFEVR